MSATSFRRPAVRFAASAAFAGLAASVSFPAQAADLTFPADNALSRALLPYSPWFFDLAVQSARSFAEVSYDRRGYDPVTGTFFVNGLHVKRDTVDVAIGRLRADLSSAMLEGVAVDTRGLDLPPQLMEGLRKIGRDKIEGSVLFNVKSNPGRSAYDITFGYDMPDIGALAMNATIENLHILVSLEDMETGAMSDEPVLSGELVKGSVAYKDNGLMPVAIDISAEEAGMSSDQLKAGIMAVPSQLAAQLIGGLPGGVSPELKDRVFAWAATAEAFLKNQDAIRITFNPAEPVQLQRLQSGEVDEALITALNPTVTRGFAEVAAPPPPTGSLAFANTLISGAGAPQDREAGARAMMTLAQTGDPGAIRSIAVTFGDGPAPDLQPNELANLYSFLLVARAHDDASVSDGALASLTARLPAETVLAAEHDAAAYFAAHGGKPEITAETIGKLDAGALRVAAYDFYEGHRVPRDFTRSLTLALVASAAGDGFAARLRDELTEAAQRKDIVVGVSTAHTEAAKLWTAYQAAHADNAQ